jgi:hypothetical protein
MYIPLSIETRLYFNKELPGNVAEYVGYSKKHTKRIRYLSSYSVFDETKNDYFIVWKLMTLKQLKKFLDDSWRPVSSEDISWKERFFN